MATSSLDAAIDRLYQLPLGEFIAARNAAAGEFGGDQAKTIRALQKPNGVAWALNQLYWAARPVYDRLVDAAAELRSAQADALMGRPADLRAAGDAHRVALQSAVREAAAILQRGGHAAPPDAIHALTAALEALPWPEPRGRLVRPPSPIGFAALAGLPTAARPASDEPRATSRQEEPDRPAAKPPGSASVIPFEKAARAKASLASVQEKPHERVREAERAREEAKRAKEESAQRKREEERRAREQHARDALDRARGDAEAAAGRLRASEARLGQAREAERAAQARKAEARRKLAEAEAAHAEAARAVTASESAEREARREAESSEAAARKAEQAWQRASSPHHSHTPRARS